MKSKFEQKHGHHEDAHTRIMAAQVTQNRRDQAVLEASLVRAGRVAPGQTDVLARPHSD